MAKLTVKQEELYKKLHQATFDHYRGSAPINIELQTTNEIKIAKNLQVKELAIVTREKLTGKIHAWLHDDFLRQPGEIVSQYEI